MNLTLDQEEKLRYMLAELGDCLDEMTRWERDFISDQIKRYDEWGSGVHLSPKQWAALIRIHEKMTDV